MPEDRLETLRLRDEAIGEAARQRAGEAAPAARARRRGPLPRPLRALRIRLLERRARP